MKLIEAINLAEKKKPKFGEDCNNCGWCCLTEVCPVGKQKGAGEMLPCKFLTDNKRCGLVVEAKAMFLAIGAGTGCCAETQKEKIKRFF